MSLSDILNLSKPGLVAVGVVSCVAVVGFSVQSLRYVPKVWDACEAMPITANAVDDDPFERVTEDYLQQTRNWSRADYCIDKKTIKGNAHIVSVLRRGKLVGGGEGFQIRIDPTHMDVTGELAHE